MIVYIQDINQDTASYDKLIFPSVITIILMHTHMSIPSFSPFPIMGSVNKEFLIRSSTEIMTKAKRPQQEPTLTQREEAEFHAMEDDAYASHPSSSIRVEASLAVILAISTSS